MGAACGVRRHVAVTHPGNIEPRDLGLVGEHLGVDVLDGLAHDPLSDPLLQRVCGYDVGDQLVPGGFDQAQR
jgi:hypothetical protein